MSDTPPMVTETLVRYCRREAIEAMKAITGILVQGQKGEEMSKNQNQENLPAVSEQTVNALAAAAEQGVLAWKDANAFGRMFKVAAAVQTLQQLLTPEAMAPIMALQNSPLGFRTDKAREGGYPLPQVREALIEATLNGVYPVGNEFNIIGGRCYITKEGFGHKLRDVPGLKWSVTPGVPEIGRDGAARVAVEVAWSLNGGERQRRTLDFAIRVNAGMGADAICGKATRKARAWLWSEVTGNEAPEGDAQEVEVAARVVGGPAGAATGKKAGKADPATEIRKLCSVGGGRTKAVAAALKWRGLGKLDELGAGTLALWLDALQQDNEGRAFLANEAREMAGEDAKAKTLLDDARLHVGSGKLEDLPVGDLIALGDKLKVAAAPDDAAAGEAAAEEDPILKSMLDHERSRRERGYGDSHWVGD